MQEMLCPIRRTVAMILIVAAVAVSPQLDAQQAAGGSELPEVGPLIDALPDVVARVDGHPITKNQLLRQADSMRQQAVQSGIQDPAHQGKEFLMLVTDALIGEYLVFKDGQSRGFVASDTEVDARMQEIAAGYTDAETFERVLKARGMDRATLRAETHQQLSIDKLFRDEIEAGVQVPEEALRAYYDQNAAQLKHPPRLRARHILKQVPEGADAEALRNELTELRRKITEDGAEFGELATSNSDDPRTRDLGGDMGWIRNTGRPGSIGLVLDGLEVGTVSEVIETQLGLHIFQVMERQPAQQITFEEARPGISKSLITLHAREEVQRRIGELKAKAQIEFLL